MCCARRWQRAPAKYLGDRGRFVDRLRCAARRPWDCRCHAGADPDAPGARAPRADRGPASPSPPPAQPTPSRAAAAWPGATDRALRADLRKRLWFWDRRRRRTCAPGGSSPLPECWRAASSQRETVAEKAGECELAGPSASTTRRRTPPHANARPFELILYTRRTGANRLSGPLDARKHMDQRNFWSFLRRCIGSTAASA